MPEVKLSDGKNISKNLLNPSSNSNIIQQASGTLGDIISLVSKGEQLLGHFENILKIVDSRRGAGSSVIQSKEPGPNITITEGPRTTNPEMSNQNLEAYFSSPQGLKKIAEAIKMSLRGVIPPKPDDEAISPVAFSISIFA